VIFGVLMGMILSSAIWEFRAASHLPFYAAQSSSPAILL
jgi:hypothetical protein